MTSCKCDPVHFGEKAFFSSCENVILFQNFKALFLPEYATTIRVRAKDMLVGGPQA